MYDLCKFLRLYNALFIVDIVSDDRTNVETQLTHSLSLYLLLSLAGYYSSCCSMPGLFLYRW